MANSKSTHRLDNGSVYHATVALIDPMGDAGSGTFGVRLTLPNQDQTIPAGRKCRVRLDLYGPVLSDAEEYQRESPTSVTSEGAHDQVSLNIDKNADTLHAQ